jgi:hypothetical protein
MSYDPHVWNVMHERQDLLPCPFCQNHPVQEQKGNKERQYRIACGYPHCSVCPHTFTEYDLEDAVVAWQLRENRNGR